MSESLRLLPVTAESEDFLFHLIENPKTMVFPPHRI